MTCAPHRLSSLCSDAATPFPFPRLTFTNDYWRDTNLLSADSAAASILTGRRLRQQFVGEHTQAVNRRGFYPQNNGTESDGTTAIAPRQIELRWSKIAFRTNAHQNTRRASVMFAFVISQHRF